MMSNSAGPTTGPTGPVTRGGTSRTGAYGFRIDGIGTDNPLLNDVPESWPVITVEQGIGESGDKTNHVDADTARVPLLTGGFVVIERREARAFLTVPRLLDHEEVAHPYLAPIAACFAHWSGWIPFHAGGVVLDGGVWGVVADREAGKSSLLAAMSLRGLAVTADDLLVVDVKADEPGNTHPENAHPGNTHPANTHIVFVGPRTLDLRQGAAEHFGVGRDLGVVGQRARFRLDLDPVDAEIPLAGWIYLGWSDELTITRSSVGDRLRKLVPGRSVATEDVDASALMRLAALPGIELARPKDWTQMDAGIDALLETVTAVA